MAINQVPTGQLHVSAQLWRDQTTYVYSWRGGDTIELSEDFLNESPCVERAGKLIRLGPFVVRLIDHDPDRAVWIAQREV